MTLHGPRTVLFGGTVADGSGGAPERLDVLVRDGSIEALVAPEARPAGGYDADLVDCSGRIVAPGFVDIHTHSDLSLLAYPGNESRVGQGITTEVVGNCGMSPAPSGGDESGLAQVIATIDVAPQVSEAWPRVEDWLAALDRSAASTHVAAQIGHGAARFAIAGDSREALTTDQLRALVRTVEEALDAGCVGVSLGLMYPPGENATRPEIAAIAAVVAARDALLSVHLREYRGTALCAAIDEVADPAREAGARLQISHLRSIGDEGGFTDALDHLEDLRQVQDIGADTYPYVHGHTTVTQLLPAEVRSAGLARILDLCRARPDHVAELFAAAGYPPSALTIMKAASAPQLAGTDVSTVPGDPWPWLVALLVASSGQVDVAVASGSWVDVDHALATPWISIASDGTALDRTHRASAAHPRSWGAFPAAYRRMREQGVPVGEAVRRMTTSPAARVGLASGIAERNPADLVVFAEEDFAAGATFAAPASAASGLDHVMVAGRFVFTDQRFTGHRPGRLLERESTGE